MDQTNYSPLINKLYRDSDMQFLLLQSIGWFSLALMVAVASWYVACVERRLRRAARVGDARTPVA